jgi:hypothetical protein
MPTGVDEDGLEVGRLTTLHGTAELRLHILARFRAQQVGEVAADQLGIRVPRRSFRRGVHVHKTTGHVVQTRGHYEAVDQPQVGSLQTVEHSAQILDQPFTISQQRGRDTDRPIKRSRCVPNPAHTRRARIRARHTRPESCVCLPRSPI